MWHNTYKDHEEDGPFSRQKVRTGKGIIGCEMHEIQGWGHAFHRPRKKKPGIFETLLTALFKKRRS
jgi:hypothetical protein